MAVRSGARRSRWPGLLIGRYPGWWRDRYGPEMEALLEDRPLRPRDAVDLLRGALDAHVRGEVDRPGAGAVAALVTGAAWTVAGAATLVQAAPPDWPGYVTETVPLALGGALAWTAATIGVARRAWMPATTGLEIAFLLAILGCGLWALVLAVAMIGGPYGAVTGAAGALAAITTLGLGIAIARATPGWLGPAVAIAGGVMLVPSPAAWLVAGAAWTAIGIAGLFVDRASTVRPGTSA